MNKRTIVNLLLLVLLVAFIAFFNYKQNNTPHAKKLTSLNIDDITEIRIPREQKKDIFIKKAITNDNLTSWMMIEPYPVKAHPFRIKTLLSLSQTAVGKQYDINALKLSDYALDTPRARIIFNKTEILFGKSNPLNNRRYLMAENKMVLLENETYALVRAQPSAFIDLYLLPQPSKIISINTSEIISKNKLDADTKQQRIESWKHAQAFSVHQYLPRKNLGKIQVQLTNQLINFEITETEPWLILARPELNIEYHLNSELKNKLLGISKEADPDA